MSAPMEDLCTEHEEAGRMGETDRAKARALLDAIKGGAGYDWQGDGEDDAAIIWDESERPEDTEEFIRIERFGEMAIRGYLASDDGAAEARAEKAEAALKRCSEDGRRMAAIAEHHRDEASRQRNAALADIHHAINSEDTRAYLVSRYGREANDG